MNTKAPQPADEIFDLALADLTDLPPRGSVAMATRCAMRLANLFRLPDAAEDRDRWRQIWDDCVSRAAHYAGGGEELESELPGLIQTAYEMAEATEGYVNYIGYVAGHALQSVACAIAVLRDSSGMRPLKLVASTFGACRVLIQRSQPHGYKIVLAALRADLDLLRTMPMDAKVDPGETGPLGALWPVGVPQGF